MFLHFSAFRCTAYTAEAWSVRPLPYTLHALSTR
jgi:hypothetical protein